MTGKAEIKRARTAMQAERLRLKEDRLTLEREQRRLEVERLWIIRERAETLALLRLLCERWGDNDWPDDLALPEIIELHLADPLGERLDAVLRRTQTLQASLDRVTERLAQPRQEAPAGTSHPGTSGRPVGATRPAVGQPAPTGRAAPTLRDVPARHIPMSVLSQSRASGRVGWVSRCTCGASSAICDEEIQADAAGRAHVAEMAERQQSIAR